MGLRGLHARKRTPYDPRMSRVKAVLTTVEPDATEDGPSADALYARTYRQRVRDGLAVCQILLGPDDIELLVRAQLLDARADGYTRAEVAAALTRVLQLGREP